MNCISFTIPESFMQQTSSKIKQDYKSAIEVYLEGLEFAPENAEILTTIGLLYIRMGENF